MFVHSYFFKECSNFDFVVGKISHSWWFRSKNFLNPHMVNLSVYLSDIVFDYNFHKNKTMARKFWYVLELHRFALYKKNCYRDVY